MLKTAAAKGVREDLCDTLADIGADTAVVPPPGYKVRLVEASAKTWEMFPAQTDLAAREITILGDKSIPYDVLKKVMATCADADYGRISLATLQKEKPVPAGFKPA